jgi:hypothetical protein
MEIIVTPWTSPRRLARAFSRLPQASLLPARSRICAAGLTVDACEPLSAAGFLAEAAALPVDEHPVSEDLLRALREAGL